MNTEFKWLIVYHKNRIYSSMLIDVQTFDLLKIRFNEELNNDNSIVYELVDREPFHGW